MQAVVLTFEHLSLSDLGCYGNSWIETPNLDRLASQSVVFDACYSSGLPETARIPSWWSGRIAPAPDATPATHVIDLLRASGVQSTLCIEDGAYREGAAAFDEVRVVEGSDAADAPSRARPCAKLIADAVDCRRLVSDSPEPQLLWVASLGVPSPWLPPRDIAGIYWEEFFDAETLRLAVAAATGDEPPGFGAAEPERYLVGALERLASIGLLHRTDPPELEEFQTLNRMVYASYVSAIDAWCGSLLDAIGNEERDDLLVIVTAAAGDLLSPHPCVNRGCPPIVDDIAHVPLFVRIGRGETVGSRRHELVSNVDLAATVAAWFQAPSEAPFVDSQDLLPLARCGSAPARHELLFGADGVGWGIRTPEFSCLCASAGEPGSHHAALGRPWLYSKPDDTRDCLDIAEQNPAIAESLAARTAAGLSDGARTGPAP